MNEINGSLQRACLRIGRGDFWHPEHRSFCWFDILNSKSYEQIDDQSTKVA